LQICATRRQHCAFTLIELLVVIAIMGLLAAIAVPTLTKFKPNVTAAATQRLLTDVNRARQLAISQHTTVYMVFVPTNYFNDPAYAVLTQPQYITELSKAQKLWDKQMIAYTFISLRSVGDQPGRPTPRYLDTWRTLPEGTYIAAVKFQRFQPSIYLDIYTNSATLPAFRVFGFRTNNLIPFPSETAPSFAGHWVTLPYIAFNYLGELVDATGQPTGQNELIPISQGAVLVPRDSHRAPMQGPPSITESPTGNTTNSFNLINIDWLTGRARVEHQEVQ
jgi:prepilin-type N-terminal cleavage/methylation domain-containing protein